MSPVLRYQQSVAAVVATVVVAGMAATADAQDVAAGQAAAAVDPYVVGQPLPPSEPGSVLLSLTLEEAIEMALERNLDLKAARLTPQTVDYQLSAARAAFNPRLQGTYGYNNQSRPNNSSILDPTLTSVNTELATIPANRAAAASGSSLSVDTTLRPRPTSAARSSRKRFGADPTPSV